MSMSTDRQILIFLLVALVVVFIVSSCSSSNKENYEASAYTGQTLSNTPNNTLFSQPTFRANISPRFDGVTPGTIYGNIAPLQMQAAPVQPVITTYQQPEIQRQPQNIATQHIEMRNPGQMNNRVSTSFADMGGNVPTKAASDQYQDLDKLSSSQIAHMIGSGTPEYQETADVMPTPDMKGAITIDPTDPKNFMYERTIFAPLKRRYGNDVDYFRGDLQIPQQQRGWFDLMPAAQSDIVTGYFDNYIDIEQTTAIKDALYERTLTQDQKDSAKVNIYGNTAKLAYENI